MTSSVRERLALALAELLEEGSLATGIQLSAWRTSWPRPIAVAVGEKCTGTRLDTESVFSTWCATKPVLSLVLLAELERAGFEIESATIGDVLAPSRSAECHLGAERVASVLNHELGLVEPSLLAASLMPVSQAILAARGSVRADQPAYSEFVYAVLVSDMIEALAGRAAVDVLSDMTEANGLKNALTFTPEIGSLESRLARIGFYIHGLPERRVPSYFDALPTMMSERRDLFGGYASASGLCSFYALFGSALEGSSAVGFPSPDYLLRALRCNRARVVTDPVLDRQCDFAAGFMIDLPRHGFVGLSERSYGHSGLRGGPFGFYDSSAGLAVACIPNGMHSTQRDIERVRSRILSAALNVLGLTTDSHAQAK